MLPIILGAVALGATGYGVKKILQDDDFKHNVKDKIQDGAMAAFEAISAIAANTITTTAFDETKKSQDSSFSKSKQFNKTKKAIYKKLKKLGFDIDIKYKQKVDDKYFIQEVEHYIKEISRILEVLVYNIELNQKIKIKQE